MSDTIEDPPTEEPVVEPASEAVEEPEPVVEPASEAVTEPVPVEQVASDIREILSTSVEEVTSEPREVTREEWLAAGPRRRKDGTWREFPEMV